MQLSEDIPATQILVNAYDEHSVVIADIEYTQSLILTPVSVEPWPVMTFADINDEALLMLLREDCDVVLIGTGAVHYPLTAQQLTLFYDKHMGIETMNTRAACRTYNLLANEGRRVLAALLIM